MLHKCVPSVYDLLRATAIRNVGMVDRAQDMNGTLDDSQRLRWNVEAVFPLIFSRTTRRESVSDDQENF